MSQATTELKKDIKKTLGDLQTLRDELRVKLHLATMDAKDEWSKLETELEALESSAEKASDQTYAAMVDLLKRLQKLRATAS